MKINQFVSTVRGLARISCPARLLLGGRPPPGGHGAVELSLPQLPGCCSGPSLLFSDTPELSQSAGARGPLHCSEEPKSKLVTWFLGRTAPCGLVRCLSQQEAGSQCERDRLWSGSPVRGKQHQEALLVSHGVIRVLLDLGTII